jgi:hypothetical protein
MGQVVSKSVIDISIVSNIQYDGSLLCTLFIKLHTIFRN